MYRCVAHNAQLDKVWLQKAWTSFASLEWLLNKAELATEVVDEREHKQFPD